MNHFSFSSIYLYPFLPLFFLLVVEISQAKSATSFISLQRTQRKGIKQWSPPSTSSSSTEIHSQSSNQQISSLYWVSGRRCLFVPSKNIDNRNEVVFKHSFDDSRNMQTHTQMKTSTTTKLPLPPIIILGGMAQSISSWEHHLPMLSRERDVFLYEYLGSGLGYRHPEYQNQQWGAGDSFPSEHDYYNNVTLTKQAIELKSILQKSFPKCAKFDIVGFSLGARIALATIAAFPTLIRKIHLTGVGLERSPYAKIVIHSWKEILQSGNQNINDKNSNDNDNNDSSISERKNNDTILHSSSLRAFAWSIIMTTYSQEFLTLNGPDKISSWVDHICNNNNPIGLLKLLEQTHGGGTGTDTSTTICDNEEIISLSSSNNNNEMLQIVQQIISNNAIYQNTDLPKGQIHMGEVDEMSTVAQARELYSLIGWDDRSDDDIIIYKRCGHAVMNEDGRTWRKNVLEYLNT